MLNSPIDPSKRPPLRAVGKKEAEAPLAGLPWRGINLAGPEFGHEDSNFSNLSPGQEGTDYFFNSRRTYNLLAQMGFKAFRIPFRWERIQPTLGGPLDPDHVQSLRTQASVARAVGGRVILDCHNYGRYVTWVGDRAVTCVLDEQHAGGVPVSGEHLADLWARMARAFSGESGVMAYGIMNEVHDMGAADWHAISARAVQAIRAEGDLTQVLVSGERWSNASNWPWVNPAEPWIDAGDGPVLYEAHCYLDHNGSGKYRRSFAEEADATPSLRDRAIDRIEPFLGWLRRNQVQGVVGEIGVPVGDPDWLAVLKPLLSCLDDAGVPCLWWAAGEAWGDYELNLQPQEGAQQGHEALIQALLEGERSQL